jgi:hypothetical protein
MYTSSGKASRKLRRSVGVDDGVDASARDHGERDMRRIAGGVIYGLASRLEPGVHAEGGAGVGVAVEAREVAA